MHKGQIGRPDMDRLLGVQTRMKSPMSLMVTLYPPREPLRVFAAQQGHINLRGERYPRMQVLSVQEMLTKNARPKLPEPNITTYVGEDNTRMALA
jgi:hypothetical protein